MMNLEDSRDKLIDLAGRVNRLEIKAIEAREQVKYVKILLDELIAREDDAIIAKRGLLVSEERYFHEA